MEYSSMPLSLIGPLVENLEKYVFLCIDRLQSAVYPARPNRIANLPDLNFPGLRGGHDGMGNHGAIPDEPLGPNISLKIYRRNGQGGHQGLVMSMNGLGLLRDDLVKTGHYDADDLLGYKEAGDEKFASNFINVNALRGLTVSQAWDRHLELTVEKVRGQMDLARLWLPRVHRLEADDLVKLQVGEFVYDVPCSSPQLVVRALQSPFFQLTKLKTSYSAEGNALMLTAPLRKGVQFSIYTKSPGILRFQLRLTSMGFRNWTGHDATLPTDKAGWVKLLGEIDQLFRPIPLELLRSRQSPIDNTWNRLDLILRLAYAMGDGDIGVAREFLTLLVIRGAVYNSSSGGRPFRRLIARSRKVGLIKRKGYSWLLDEGCLESARAMLGVGSL